LKTTEKFFNNDKSRSYVKTIFLVFLYVFFMLQSILQSIK